VREDSVVLETSARLLRMLSLLQSRPAWTAPELAERLGVTDRTIRRDVARLRELGYPVDAEPGPFGGYTLGRGGSLPPLLLDDDEAVAVAIGLRAAAEGGVVGVDEATATALAKLEQVLPARLAARVRALHDATAELRTRDPSAVDAAVLVDLAQACRQGERLRLDYRDRAGHPSERLVDPSALVRFGPRWYLVARDVDRRAWRTFRVDRVEGVRTTGELVVLDDRPDPAALVAQGMAVGPYRLVARVRLAMPAAEALDLIPRTVGVHRADGPDATVVDVGGSDAAGMVRYLAGLAVPLEVLDPPEVRRGLRDHALRLAQANAGAVRGASR
jgi:predicted DNA-binding transcriptional regulator YafY